MTAVLLVIPVLCTGQGKFYTKKARLQDFPSKTTKVVISSQSLFELCFREEVSAHWRISPFEFCSVEEYKRLMTDSSYYFLRIAKDKDALLLCLSKGGTAKDPDRSKRPFGVVSVPVGFQNLDSRIDEIQDFVERAMESELSSVIPIR